VSQPPSEPNVSGPSPAPPAGTSPAHPQAAIGAVAAAYGYPVNTEFGGHGVGRTMHESPHVSNQGRPDRGLRLHPGLTIAIEPWLARGTDRIVLDREGWTIRSADGSRTTHSELTVAVTQTAPDALTRRPGRSRERLATAGAARTSASRVDRSGHASRR
jgi:methionyl aminopeptidase